MQHLIRVYTVTSIYESMGLQTRKKIIYSKTCIKRPLSKDQKLVFKTNYLLMQVKSIAGYSKGERSAILLTFIKLPFVFKIFVLSIFELPFYTCIKKVAEFH